VTLAAVLALAGCDGDEDELDPGKGEFLSIQFSPVVVCENANSDVRVSLFDESGNCLDGVPVALSLAPSPPGTLTATAGLTVCPPDPDDPPPPISTFSSDTTGSYTLTATAGTITGTALVSVVAPGGGSLTLEPTTAGDTIFTTCTPTLDTILVSGVRLDGSGVPISGALISLEVVASSGGLSATLLSVPVVTASDGTYSATLVPEISSADCTTCATTACSVTVRAVSDCDAESGDLVLTESF
jgi:hypothetical protein